MAIRRRWSRWVVIGRAGTSTRGQTLRRACISSLVGGLVFSFDLVHVQIAQGGQLWSEGQECQRHGHDSGWQQSNETTATTRQSNIPSVCGIHGARSVEGVSTRRLCTAAAVGMERKDHEGQWTGAESGGTTASRMVRWSVSTRWMALRVEGCLQRGDRDGGVVVVRRQSLPLTAGWSGQV